MMMMIIIIGGYCVYTNKYLEKLLHVGGECAIRFVL